MTWRQLSSSFDNPLNPEYEQEARLVEQARAGSERAFSALLARYQQPVFRLIYHLVGDEDESRDLTRLALKHALRRLPRVPSGFSIRPWLLRVATLVALDAVRQRGTSAADFLSTQQLPAPSASHSTIIDADPTMADTMLLSLQQLEEKPETAIANAWDRLPVEIERELVRRILADLPEGDAELLALGVVGQVPTRDLAAIAGTSQRSIRRRIARALILFQTYYQNVRTEALPPPPVTKDLPSASFPSLDAARRGFTEVADRMRRGVLGVREGFGSVEAQERLQSLSETPEPAASLVTAPLTASAVISEDDSDLTPSAAASLAGLAAASTIVLPEVTPPPAEPSETLSPAEEPTIRLYVVPDSIQENEADPSATLLVPPVYHRQEYGRTLIDAATDELDLTPVPVLEPSLEAQPDATVTDLQLPDLTASEAIAPRDLPRFGPPVELDEVIPVDAVTAETPEVADLVAIPAVQTNEEHSPFANSAVSVVTPGVSEEQPNMLPSFVTSDHTRNEHAESAALLPDLLFVDELAVTDPVKASPLSAVVAHTGDSEGHEGQPDPLLVATSNSAEIGELVPLSFIDADFAPATDEAVAHITASSPEMVAAPAESATVVAPLPSIDISTDLHGAPEPASEIAPSAPMSPATSTVPLFDSSDLEALTEMSAMLAHVPQRDVVGTSLPESGVLVIEPITRASSEPATPSPVFDAGDLHGIMRPEVAPRQVQVRSVQRSRQPTRPMPSIRQDIDETER